jgi:hypothetical protein
VSSPKTKKGWRWLSDIRLCIEAALSPYLFRREEDIEAGDGPRYTLEALERAIGCERRRYPTPLIPTDKRAFTANLMRYAKRLHYERMLTPEAMISTALHFWGSMPKEARPRGEKFSVCYKAGIAVYRKIGELDGLRVKLEPEALRSAHSRGGKKRAAQRQEEAMIRRQKVARLRGEGLTQKEIAKALGVGIATVKRDYAFLANRPFLDAPPY